MMMKNRNSVWERNISHRNCSLQLANYANYVCLVIDFVAKHTKKKQRLLLIFAFNLKLFSNQQNKQNSRATATDKVMLFNFAMTNHIEREQTQLTMFPIRPSANSTIQTAGTNEISRKRKKKSRTACEWILICSRFSCLRHNSTIAWFAAEK